MRKSSARAKGRATRSSRPATGTGASCRSGSRFVSRLRRNRRDRRVTREAALLPPTTAQQARPGSPEAQWDKSKTVTAIETTCSRISTATSSRIRPAAVKYPVMTPPRHTTGKKAAKIRRAARVRRSPIQASATRGAQNQTSSATAVLKRKL